MDYEAGSFRHLSLLLVLVAVLVAAGVAMAVPGPAQAFLGESAVLNEAKTDLTGPAKTILEKPTFLPDSEAEASALGGAVEASGAASIFEAGTILPALGAFGLGATIGSEICHVIGIEGCWQFTGTTPAETAKTYAWEFLTTGEHAYQWWWTRGQALYDTQEAAECTTGSEWPADATFDGGPPKSVATECLKKGEWKKLTWSYREPYRYSMDGRAFAYSPTDTAMPNYEPGGKPYAASSEWSKKTAAALKGATGAKGRLGQKVASEIKGSNVPDPYEVTVPSCVGLTAAACLVVLEELGLTPSVANLSYLEAVIPSPNLDEPILSLEAQAEKVQKLSPTAGTKVLSGSKVTVTANPKLAGMPLIVPDDPAPGESAEAWRAKRLAPQKAGWTVKPEVLGEATLSPAYSPNAVVRPVPEPGTRLDPSTSHETTVQVNPSTAPPVGAAWSPPSIPAVDMSPLSGFSPCGVFPFGLFCWVGEALGQFNTTGKCPSANVPVGHTHFDLTLCGSTAETVMSIARPALLLLFIVGCGFLFARGTRAIGDDG